MRRGRPVGGDHVVVIGAGGIGAFLVHAAARHGAHVTAVDLDAGRLAVAAALGAERTVQTTSEAPLEEQLTELPTGRRSSTSARLPTGGAGGCGDGRTRWAGRRRRAAQEPGPVNLLSVSLDEKELVGTLAHVLDADLGHAIDLLEDGAELWERVAPVVVPLEDVVSAGLQPMIDGGETPIKLLLDPHIDSPR